MTTTGPEAAPFTAETFQNEYLAAGVDTVDAVVTVTAAGDPAAGAAPTPSSDRAEVIIFDTSGSMGVGPQDGGRQGGGRRRGRQPRRRRVVRGHRRRPRGEDAVAAGRPLVRRRRRRRPGGRQVGHRPAPSRGRHRHRHLARPGPPACSPPTPAPGLATPSCSPTGATSTSSPTSWPPPSPPAGACSSATAAGVGVDWEVEELRGIATALLGTVDIVADPEELAADFRAMISSSQSRALPDVKLRLWAPAGRGARVGPPGRARGARPHRHRATASGSRWPATSCWAAGRRASPATTTCASTVQAGGVGDEMLAGRVSLVLADGDGRHPGAGPGGVDRRHRAVDPHGPPRRPLHGPGRAGRRHPGGARTRPRPATRRPPP